MKRRKRTTNKMKRSSWAKDWKIKGMMKKKGKRRRTTTERR